MAIQLPGPSQLPSAQRRAALSARPTPIESNYSSANLRPADLRGGSVLAAGGEALARADATMKKAEAERDKFEAASAESYVLQSSLKLETSLEEDQDYSSWGKKYNAGMAEIQKQANGMVTNPEVQQYLGLAVQDSRARGEASLKSKAYQRQKAAMVASAEETLASNADTIARVGMNDPLAAKLLENSRNLINSMDVPDRAVRSRKFAEDVSTLAAQLMSPGDAVEFLKPDADGKYTKNGTWADMVPVEARAKLLEGAQADQLSAIRTQNFLNEQAEKEKQSSLLNEFYAGTLTSQKIHAAGLSAMGAGGEKAFMDMLKEGPKQGNPVLYSQLYQQVLEGTLKDPSQILPYLNLPDGDGLSVEQAQNLTSTMSKDAGSSVDNKMQAEFFSSIKRSFIVFPEDAAGQEAYLHALPIFIKGFQDGAKNKIPMSELIDPQSKNYVGKMAPNPRSPVQKGIDYLNTPAKQTRADEIRRELRSTTDPVKRSVLIKEAEDLGLIRKSSVKAPVSQ